MTRRATGIDSASCVKALAFLQTRLAATGEYPCTLQDAADEAVMSLRTFTWAVDQLVAAGIVKTESLGRRGTIFRAGSVSPVACAIDESGNVSIAKMAKSGNDAPLPIHGGLEAVSKLTKNTKDTTTTTTVPEGDSLASLVAGLNQSLGRETTSGETKQLQGCEASHVEAASLVAALDRLTAALAPLACLPALVARLGSLSNAESPVVVVGEDFKGRTTTRPRALSPHQESLASFACSPGDVNRAVEEAMQQKRDTGEEILSPGGFRRSIRVAMTTEDCRAYLEDADARAARVKKAAEDKVNYARLEAERAARDAATAAEIRARNDKRNAEWKVEKARLEEARKTAAEAAKAEEAQKSVKA